MLVEEADELGAGVRPSGSDAGTNVVIRTIPYRLATR